MNTQQAKKQLGPAFTSTKLGGVLQALRANGLIEDGTPEQRLGALADEHFKACADDVNESYILHTDYGWSAQQIVALRKSRNHPHQFLTGADDPYFDEAEVLREITTHNRGWRFEANCSAERVFLFFYFLEINQTYRDQALAHVNTVKPLIDDELLQKVATALEWNEHQLLEMRLMLKDDL